MAYLFREGTESTQINQLVNLQNKNPKTEVEHFKNKESNFQALSKKEELFQVFVAFMT